MSSAAVSRSRWKVEPVVRIPLRNKLGSIVAYAIVDQADAQCASVRWYVNYSKAGTAYVRRETYKKGKRRTFYLHRWIMRAPKGVPVDHKDGDTFNNRRSNLELTTAEENTRRMVARIICERHGTQYIPGRSYLTARRSSR